VLLVTHDVDELSMADQVWVLEDGHVVDVLPGDDFQQRLWLARRKGVRWPDIAAS
jgi:ABC-type proline/glycine betaine transport system ATPase subunit